MGAIVKEITEGALKWYEMAGWKVLKEKENKKETNSKKNATT